MSSDKILGSDLGLDEATRLEMFGPARSAVPQAIKNVRYEIVHDWIPGHHGESKDEGGPILTRAVEVEE